MLQAMPVDSLGEIVSFGPGAYGVRYGNYVSTFFVGSVGVCVVDPSGQTTPRMPRLIQSTIAIVTDQPVTYVVYSHWGADHGRGGALFAPTAQFVAHPNAARKVGAEQDPNSPMPTMLISQPAHLSLGDRTIDLYPTEFSDADDYLIVHEPKSRVVITVDFVQSRTVPFRRLFGVPMRVVDRLQWLDETLDFEAVVSGHCRTAVCGTRQDVREQRQYYLDLADAVSRARGDPDAARALLEPKYGTWQRFDQMVNDNIHGYLGWSA
jgi:glyoxylase-like metal-dependent hydrolase (beta-lactamase superfamily II)